MLIGIGTDIIEIERIKSSLSNKHFLDRIYTSEEKKLFNGRNYQTLAGNFAAKEAIAKALGTGFKNINPKDIEILRDAKGKPYVNLYNSAFSAFSSLNAFEVHITISHSKKDAIAYAIIE